MFTGLVEVVGRVRNAVPEESGTVLEIEAPGFPALDTGASVSVQGCCQTVIAGAPGSFSIRSMRETLDRTTLGALGTGQRVNLERSLRLGQELGGHVVTGHVDGVAEVEEVAPEATQTRLVIRVPAELSRLIAAKGSLCVDGVSLTAGEVDGARVALYLIPYTLEHSVASGYRAGSRVNVEVDVLARYVARWLETAS